MTVLASHQGNPSTRAHRTLAGLSTRISQLAVESAEGTLAAARGEQARIPSTTHNHNLRHPIVFILSNPL